MRRRCDYETPAICARVPRAEASGGRRLDQAPVEEDPSEHGRAVFALRCVAPAGRATAPPAPRRLRRRPPPSACGRRHSSATSPDPPPSANGSMRRPCGGFSVALRCGLQRRRATGRISREVHRRRGRGRFGLGGAREDDAIRAVRAAREARDAVHELGVEAQRLWHVRLDARIGVMTGEVVFGSASATASSPGTQCQ